MRREDAVEALTYVHTLLFKSGATQVVSFLGENGHRPHLTVTTPGAGRDEAAAMAIALDANVHITSVRAGSVTGVAVVSDTWAPGPIDVAVQVLYGPPVRDVQSYEAAAVAALVPAQRDRSGPMQVIEADGQLHELAQDGGAS